MVSGDLLGEIWEKILVGFSPMDSTPAATRTSDGAAQSCTFANPIYDTAAFGPSAAYGWTYLPMPLLRPPREPPHRTRRQHRNVSHVADRPADFTGTHQPHRTPPTNPAIREIEFIHGVKVRSSELITTVT